MIYRLPFVNEMPEAEFEDSLYTYISIDDTFNSENNFKLKSIDDQIVVFKKGKRIVVIDKDDQYITFDFDNNTYHFEIYKQIAEMVQKFIIDYYKPTNLKKRFMISMVNPNKNHFKFYPSIGMVRVELFSIDKKPDKTSNYTYFYKAI